MESTILDNADHELEVQEAKPKLAQPPMYKVVLLNDDYTPMEFVVEVLQYFFNLSKDKANHVMWQVHSSGKGICGVYTCDVAETKVTQVNEYAKENEYPLLCAMEVN